MICLTTLPIFPRLQATQRYCCQRLGAAAQTRIVGTSPGNTALKTVNCFYFTFYLKTFQALTLCLLNPLFHIKETSLYFWPLCGMPPLPLSHGSSYAGEGGGGQWEHVLSMSTEGKVVLIHFSSPKKTAWSLNLGLLKTVQINLSTLWWWRLLKGLLFPSSNLIILISGVFEFSWRCIWENLKDPWLPQIWRTFFASSSLNQWHESHRHLVLEMSESMFLGNTSGLCAFS